MIDPYRQVVDLRGKVADLSARVEQQAARIAELERKLDRVIEAAQHALMEPVP